MIASCLLIAMTPTSSNVKMPKNEQTIIVTFDARRLRAGSGRRPR